MFGAIDRGYMAIPRDLPIPSCHVLRTKGLVAQTRDSLESGRKRKRLVSVLSTQCYPRESLVYEACAMSSNSLVLFGVTVAGLVASGALILNKEGQPLQASAGVSLAAFISTSLLIPALRDPFIKAGFSGKDLAKPKRPIL